MFPHTRHVELFAWLDGPQAAFVDRLLEAVELEVQQVEADDDHERVGAGKTRRFPIHVHSFALAHPRIFQRGASAVLRE